MGRSRAEQAAHRLVARATRVSQSAWMRLWETASLAFFVYLALAAPAVRPAGGTRLIRLLIGAGAGLTLTIISASLPHQVVLHDWMLAPLLLLTGYWTSGLLFVRPRARQEAFLMALDRRAGIVTAAGSLPRTVVELLEFAYLGVYPLIPIALILHLTFAADPDPERFWAVILITDYVCFAAMPFVQTRPPRALEAGTPWQSRVRRFNLGVLGAASVQVNTFPSGHAAEGLAAALLVAGAPVPIVSLMIVAALAVSAGAVLGRYHFLGDALAGWVVAIIVWIFVR